MLAELCLTEIQIRPATGVVAILAVRVLGFEYAAQFLSMAALILIGVVLRQILLIQSTRFFSTHLRLRSLEFFSFYQVFRAVLLVLTETNIIYFQNLIIGLILL